MFRRLLLLFILVPILELALLIQLGRWVGLWPTLALIVTTGLLGAALASREGLRAWHALQSDLAQGRVPGRPILDGLAVFAGGALLLTPGLVTDLAGFALLLRPTRRWIQNRAMRRLRAAMSQGTIYVHTAAGWTAGPPPGPGGSDAAGRPRGRKIEQEDGS